MVLFLLCLSIFCICGKRAVSLVLRRCWMYCGGLVRQDSGLFSMKCEQEVICARPNVAFSEITVNNIVVLSESQWQMAKYFVPIRILRYRYVCCALLHSLPYVEATILELHRYKTLVLFAVPHQTLKDTEVDGYFIPAGTTVCWYVYLYMARRICVWVGIACIDLGVLPFLNLCSRVRHQILVTVNKSRISDNKTLNGPT